ncbi:hypothetical protein ACFQS3_22220 [Glycomyces mayteni]|uniref:Uncharacterized protein n=1 Tax=Glycomyces mayteni TaxID=543887 RepID=A0ABW2DFB5_9ACTN|nr:hypothetical protein GCM10025732_36490 [Glycomyces mayteni]
MSDAAQGQVYTEYIAAQLAGEHGRRVSLQARSQWLVSAAAVLLTLMTGVVLFAPLEVEGGAPGWLRAGYLVSLAALVVAAAAGIWAGRAYRYEVAAEATLSAMLREHWGDHPVDAGNLVGRLQVAELISLRHGNNLMARWVLAGQVAQLVFLALFTACAVLDAALAR